MPDSPVTERELIVQRVIQNTPEEVFVALSDPQHLAHWWGAHGFTASTRTFEFTIGGEWDFTLHGPDDTTHDISLEWQEIVPHERVAYRRADDDDDEMATITRITIEPVTNGSELTLQTIFTSRDQRLARESAETEHAEQSLERLATHLSEDTGDTP